MRSGLIADVATLSFCANYGAFYRLSATGVLPEGVALRDSRSIVDLAHRRIES